MPEPTDLKASILAAWRTNCRVTSLLVDAVPTALWPETIPGYPRRTVRMLVAHFHNSRARWIRTLGATHGVPVPPLVDVHRVGRRELVTALKQSGKGIEALLTLGLEAENQVPCSPKYVWRNLPLDVGHVLAYFVAHEAHHRGQIVMMARQLGHPLSPDVVNGLWHWSRHRK